MDDIFVEKLKNNSKINKIIENYSKIDFLTYYNPSDPSRLAKKFDIGIELYKFSKTVLEKISEDTDFVESDILNGFGGGMELTNFDFCILCYCNLPFRNIVGTTWISRTPLFCSFNKTETNIIPIIIPFNNNNFIILNEIHDNKKDSKDILLLPGKFNFINISINNVIYSVAKYNTLPYDNLIKDLNNPDIIVTPIIKPKFKTATDVLNYLLSLHIERVQTGYFAPEKNPYYESFITYGQNFHVNNMSSLSYYENLASNEELFNRDNFHLPLENEKIVFVTLYIRECDLNKQFIPAEILSNPIFNKEIKVNIQLIDLNFMWTITPNSKANINILGKQDTFYARYLNSASVKEGKFILSPDDKECLYYFTHNPGQLFIIGGTFKNNRLE